MLSWETKEFLYTKQSGLSIYQDDRWVIRHHKTLQKHSVKIVNITETLWNPEINKAETEIPNY